MNEYFDFACSRKTCPLATAQQLREAFPWETAPRYLLRDRDGVFGHTFVDQVTAMGMSEVLSTPGSPWQRAYIERVIGTMRRECLDHVIVCSERSLRHHLRFVDYYHQSRTHLGLHKDPRSHGQGKARSGRRVPRSGRLAPSLRAPRGLKSLRRPRTGRPTALYWK